MARPPRDHAIGVGMGGSCPQCHAPIDVGQEFCLECGSHVRSQKRAASGRPGSAAAAARRSGGGFPWTPFLVVLALVTIGVVSFAMVNGSEQAGTTITEPPAAGLTNTTPPPEEEFPPIGDDTAPAADECPPPGAPQEPVTDPDTGTPAVPPMPTDATGAPCPDDSTGTDSPAPGIEQPSIDDLNGGDDGSGTGDDAAADGTSWPAGKSGYTVVVMSLAKDRYSQDDADLRAANTQAKGIKAGVLDSDEYSSLRSGLWVIFSGVFDSEAEATEHQEEVRSKGELGAYVRPVEP